MVALSAGVKNIQVLPYSSRNVALWRGKADWVLVDAPCTATGTLRRQPEHRYSFTDTVRMTCTRLIL